MASRSARADVPGVHPGRVNPLQHRDGVVAATHEVQCLGETFQVLDVQRAGLVDPGESVDRLHPPPPAVSLPSPLQLRTNVHPDAPNPLPPCRPGTLPNWRAAKGGTERSVCAIRPHG